MDSASLAAAWDVAGGGAAVSDPGEPAGATDGWAGLGCGLLLGALLLAMMRAEAWGDVLQAGLLCFILAELRRR